MAKTPKTSAMVEVVFLGPRHRLEAFGQFVKRGESALFSEAEAYALRADDRIRIEVLGPHGDTDQSGGHEPSEPAADDGEGQHTDPDLKEE